MNYCRLAVTNLEPWAELFALAFGRQPVEMQALGQIVSPGLGLGDLAWGAWEGNRLVAQYSCLVSRVTTAGANTESPHAVAQMARNESGRLHTHQNEPIPLTIPEIGKGEPTRRAKSRAKHRFCPP